MPLEQRINPAMTEDERLKGFSEELQLLCQKYACMQIVVTEENVAATLRDGSRMRGARDSIEVVLLPMDNPPEQAETKST